MNHLLSLGVLISSLLFLSILDSNESKEIKKPCLYDPELTEYLKTEKCTKEGNLKKECKLYCEYDFYLEGERSIKCNFKTGQWGQEYSNDIKSVCNDYRPCNKCLKLKCPNKKNAKCTTYEEGRYDASSCHCEI